MPPPLPDLGRLRLASPDDVLRAGIVATAGFYYSEHFQWVRPHHTIHPLDTILFYQHEVVAMMQDPAYIVLVVLDAYDPEESKRTDAIIPDGHGWQYPDAGADVVVGLAIMKLESGSARRGQYQNETSAYPRLPEYLHRDEEPARLLSTNEIVEHVEAKYFVGMSTIERLVVHPAYWHRGHGATLIRWGLMLAEIDKVEQGVSATSMGAEHFRCMNFSNITRIDIEGDAKDPRGLSFDLLRYVPSKTEVPTQTLT